MALYELLLSYTVYAIIAICDSPRRTCHDRAGFLHAAAPHRWADGALCVFGVSTQWNPGTHRVMSAIELGRSWMRHYDQWQTTGQWPEDSA